MGMPAHIPLLLALACSVGDQAVLVIKGSDNHLANEAAAQDSASTSGTYSDTLRMLNAWLDTDEDEQIARLFSVGDTRTSDLLAACRSADDGIAGAAFLTLQMLGKGDSECADSVWQKHTGLTFSGAENLSVAEFDRIEQWLAKKRSRSSYECGGEDEPLIDDSLVYALILNGSPRSESVLTGMRRLERACAVTDTIAGETLEQAQSLISEAKEIGHDLTLDRNIHKSVRASAFFLPPEYRKGSNVAVLARTDDRILLDVSYVCGRLCGRGYFVVLRRAGPVWNYSLIRMARIS
jgi:hypothetical protein